MKFSAALDPRGPRHPRAAPDRPDQRERRHSGAGAVLSIPVPDEEHEFAAYANMVCDHWRMVAGVFLALFACAALLALLLPPVYEASMLIYVEEASPSPSRNALNDVASLFDTKKAASAEMELLRSRAVAGATVEHLGMAITARPDTVPVLGKLMRTLRPGQLSTPGLFGIGGQVWGSESIDVSELAVPPGWTRRTLYLTALADGRYGVDVPTAGLHFEGAVGQLLQVATGAGPLLLKVARLHARPGARFLLRRESTAAAIGALQHDLLITEQGRQSGVIEVRFEAGDPESAYAVLQEVGRQYMAQNLRHKSEEADKSLAFLDTQLPKLKANLERAESDYNNFRHRHGTVDFAEEARLSLTQAAAARARRSELVQRRTELLTRFTVRHPMVRGVTGQIADIDRQQAATAEHIKALPLLEQEAGRLGREIKVNTDLYTALANTAQQLRIVSVGKVSNVRMVDAPMVDDEPVRPRRKAILVCGALVGLLAGLTAVLIRKNFGGAVDDPLHIETLMGARVVTASIPHSSAQAGLARRGARSGKAALLARAAPADGAIEALRSFRASLRFSLPQFDNNVIMFAGPTSGMGKSFISANFAAVLAAGGQRVLLIDADLRNGCLHQVFGVPRGDGLREAASGAVAPATALVRGVVPNLDLMTTGSLAGERSDLLLQVDVGALLGALRGHYDLVLVDSPPVLALADPLVIGSHAGAVFLVVRAGVSTAREIAEAVKRLNLAGIAPAGIVFNDVKPRLSYYGYKYAYRHVGQLEFAA
ncbi:polysaccharide biosynthesis tyrosine autokinase [Massilia sp. DWR3-1-1]|uniref:polysaccharide biosynthesis tyrosine autokinase n=1 Tax=Massilia sp. DWR3-1-1 TaxID=2804559 RepID=UPI003CED6580